MNKATELANSQYDYLNAQIQTAWDLKNNGELPNEEWDALDRFVIQCEQQKSRLASEYKLRFDFKRQ